MAKGEREGRACRKKTKKQSHACATTTVAARQGHHRRHVLSLFFFLSLFQTQTHRHRGSPTSPASCIASSAYLGRDTGSETPWPLESVHGPLSSEVSSSAAAARFLGEERRSTAERSARAAARARVRTRMVALRGGGGGSEGRRQRKREPEKRQGRCEERWREKAFCFFPFLFDLSTPSHSLDPLSTHSLADETVLPFSFPLFFHPSFELVRDITNAFPTLRGPRNRHSRARERAERMRGVDCL